MVSKPGRARRSGDLFGLLTRGAGAWGCLAQPTPAPAGAAVPQGRKRASLEAKPVQGAFVCHPLRCANCFFVCFIFFFPWKCQSCSVMQPGCRGREPTSPGSSSWMRSIVPRDARLGDDDWISKRPEVENKLAGAPLGTSSSLRGDAQHLLPAGAPRAGEGAQRHQEGGDTGAVARPVAWALRHSCGLVARCRGSFAAALENVDMFFETISDLISAPD